MLAFILLTCIFTGAACSEQQTPGQTTLKFVTWKPNQPEIWDEVIRMFENQYPNIRVDREVAPHSSSAYHDLLTQKLRNRDTSVDVFFMDVI